MDKKQIDAMKRHARLVDDEKMQAFVNGVEEMHTENTRLLADVEAARLVLEQERKANRRAIMELEQKIAELTDRAERLQRAISPSVEL